MKFWPLLLLLFIACNSSPYEYQQQNQAIDNHVDTIERYTLRGEKLYKEKCSPCHRLSHNKLAGWPLSEYSDTARQIRALYKFNTSYHHDTTLVYWHLDTIDYYVYNYKSCSGLVGKER